jgi:steroid delta-isomerase-like uncharacterized protein
MITTTPSSSDVSRAASTVADALEVCNHHDVEALARLLADEVAFDNPVTGPTDRDGMLAFHRALFGGFPDIHYEAIELTGAGDRVVVECQISGSHLGSYAGVPPTARRLSLGAAFVIGVSGGRIASWRSYFDRVPVFRLLGRIE